MLFQAMPLIRRPRPFSDPDWAFEIKWDGFRALAHIENGRCRLVSRNGNEFKSFPALNIALPLECRAQQAIIDGEIVCLDLQSKCARRRPILRMGVLARVLDSLCLQPGGLVLPPPPSAARRQQVNLMQPE